MRKPTKSVLTEQLAQATVMNEVFVERLAALELALEDRGWRRLGSGEDYDFSRAGLDLIMEQARLAYLKNPLIRRGVDVSALYVFGQGIEVSSEDDRTQQAIAAIWNDPKNQRAVTSDVALAQMERDLACKGNVFLAVVDSPAGWQWRTVRTEEIRDIVCNPEDSAEPWMYHRQYTQYSASVERGKGTAQVIDRQYADILAPDAVVGPTFGGKPVDESRIYHVKVGAMGDMLFGVPEIYPALDWARAHKQFLEDCATVMRALSRFASQITLKSSTREQLAATRRRMETTLGTGAGGTDTNPPATTGATFIGSENAKYEPVRVQGATISPSDGRQFRLQVAAAMGLPETFFGDVDVGNFATSQTLDRPTELKFMARQSLWRSTIQDLLAYCVSRELRTDPAGLSITVQFPPILDKDVPAELDALIKAGASGYVPSETISQQMLSLMGIKDISDQLAKLADERSASQPSEGLEDELRRALAKTQEALRRLEVA